MTFLQSSKILVLNALEQTLNLLKVGYFEASFVSLSINVELPGLVLKISAPNPKASNNVHLKLIPTLLLQSFLPTNID